MSGPGGGRPVVPGRGRLRPLGLDEVRITGGFWAERQRVNAVATLGHCHRWMERLGWIDNFRAAAAGGPMTGRRGRSFADSDVYKLMEAMAWELGRSPDDELESNLSSLVDTVAAAQEDDGYLNTCFGRAGQTARYRDLEWGHELYCFGHLFQAAVARGRTGGDDRLVDVARRAADHVCEVFAAGGNDGVGGHPEIELGLVELARLTGEKRYLEQAASFVDRRGHERLADTELGRSYYQDDLPVRTATVLRGHAVRALYLAAGSVDVAVETGDDELLRAVEGQLAAAVARRTYLTGGMGARHSGEAFGNDFALPPDRAYAETCAGVGAVMVAWRLLLETGEVSHADLIERVLCNVIAGSPAPDGESFFYVNTLHERNDGEIPAGDDPHPRAASTVRAPWFTVSCCPTNVARTLASLAAYTVTADATGLQVHQYGDLDVDTTLDDGRRVGISVTTGYPDDGAVSVRITESDGAPWSLSLRVPAWVAGDAVLTTPSGPRSVGTGMATVEHPFRPGDEVRLVLPMQPHWTTADPRIEAVAGCVAVERGPVVWCLEEVDLPGSVDFDRLTVDTVTPPATRRPATLVQAAAARGTADGWPYGTPVPHPIPNGSAPIEIPLVPYHRRATRGPTRMRVWLPASRT